MLVELLNGHVDASSKTLEPAPDIGDLNTLVVIPNKIETDLLGLDSAWVAWDSLLFGG